MAKPPGDAEAQIRAYKLLLSAVLDQRPSGTRQRLADALGKHRSFVTQITSPGYATPIPRRHLATILAVCHFSLPEREEFLAAYGKAHQGAGAIGDATRKMRHVSLLAPDLGDEKANAAFDRAVIEFIGRMSALMKGGDE